MTRKILVGLVALTLLIVLVGCGGTSDTSLPEVKDCGTAQLKDLSAIFGPNPPPLDLSGETEMKCFEKELSECKPAKISTVSHDGGTTGWFEIKGGMYDKCNVDVFSQKGTDPAIHVECPYDLAALETTVSQYDSYNQEGGTAFAFILKAAFTVAIPPVECIVKS